MTSDEYTTAFMLGVIMGSDIASDDGNTAKYVKMLAKAELRVARLEALVTAMARALEIFDDYGYCSHECKGAFGCKGKKKNCVAKRRLLELGIGVDE